MPNSALSNPPQIAVKISKMVFFLGIVISFLIIVYAVYRINFPIYANNLGDEAAQKYYFVVILLGGLSATLFSLGLRSNSNLTVNISLLLAAVGISVYGVESYLEFSKEELSASAIRAKEMGIPYDTRTVLEVLGDLNDAGIKAYPNFRPRLDKVSSGSTIINGRIYPIGGISSITTILNNEAGYYPIIQTDEYGFNNPKGLYEERKVDIVLIGDSYTEGYSVHANETISAVLRILGFNTISLGKAGNGPLVEFATLKEYATLLKPKIVLWLYYVNDFEDLRKEMDSSLLKKYLNEDNFSQNLMSKQNEIDDLLINYFQSERRKEKGERRKEKGERKGGKSKLLGHKNIKTIQSSINA